MIDASRRVVGCVRRWNVLRLVLGLVVMGLFVAVVPASSQPTVPDPATSGKPSPAFTRADPDFRRGLDALAAERRRRATPAAAKARRASRRRFRHLSRAEAITRARATFPEATREELFDGGDHGDIKVERAVGEFSSVVKDRQTGRTLVASSTSPLRDKNAQGKTASVDLSLKDMGTQLAPENALAPMKIKERSAAKVRFPAIDLSFGLAGGAKARTATVRSDRAYFAETETDSDAFVAPTPDGAELSVQLRSEDSPERFSLAFDLPEGATLKRAVSKHPIPNDPPQTIEVAKDGKPIAYVSPPIAHDAEGMAVPSKITAKGDRVILEVDHRGRDLMYPLIVDPEVHQYFIDAAWSDWVWGQSLGASSGGFGRAVNDPAYYPRGLYQSHPTNTYNANYSYANFVYRAPPNTHIYRFTPAGMAHEPLTINGLNHTVWFNGIMNSPYTAWENVSYTDQGGGSGGNPFGPKSTSAYGFTHDFCQNGAYRCDPRAGSEQNYAVIGFQTINATGACCGVYSGGAIGRNKTQYATTYLSEQLAPTLTGDQPASSGWRNDNAQRTTILNSGANDAGLGVYALSLTGAATGSTTKRPACTGYAKSPEGFCPFNYSTQFSYTLDEGTSTLGLQAQDAVDNYSPIHAWTEHIDRTPPTLSLSGSLYDHRNQAADHRDEGLYDKGYTLDVSAQDGSRSSAAAERSGVRAIDLQVTDSNGQVVQNSSDPAPQDCDSSCPKSRKWTLDTDTLGDGVYTATASARDGVGLSRSVDFSITIDRHGDIVHAQRSDGDPSNSPDAVIDSEWVRVNSTDARVEQDDRLATRHTISCSQASGQCGETRERSVNESADPSDSDTYVTYRGTSADDPRLDSIAHINSLAARKSGAAADTGPIDSVLAAWQHPPPAHAPQFSHYAFDTQDEEASGDTATVHVDLYLDAGSGYPLKERLTYPAGDILVESFTYDGSRRETSDYSAEFFAAPRPTTLDGERNVQFDGDAPVGPMEDKETGAGFQPYALGTTPAIGTQTYCLSTSDEVRETDSTAQPQSLNGMTGDAFAPVTEARAIYATSAPSCAAGSGTVQNPDLTVTTVARSSTQASVRRTYYASAIEAATDDPARNGVVPVIVGLTPTSASVIALDDQRESALIDLPQSTVMITGVFTLAQVPAIAKELAPR
jgi:hypothetical protein